MSKLGLALMTGMILGLVLWLTPEMALAQFSGGGLESKVNSVTRGLTHFLLPAASVIGLIYASILAATGDASAKQRMVLVLFASVIGFLAPLIIKWLQGIAS